MLALEPLHRSMEQPKEPINQSIIFSRLIFDKNAYTTQWSDKMYGKEENYTPNSNHMQKSTPGGSMVQIYH